MLNLLFFFILVAKNSILVQFKIIQFIIVSLATLRVLCKKVSFDKFWKVESLIMKYQYKFIYFYLLNIPWYRCYLTKKKRVYKGVLVVGKVSFFVFEVESLLKTMEGLYGISLITPYTNCIFRELIPYCHVFYIKKMKLHLLRFYIVNRVFLTSIVL